MAAAESMPPEKARPGLHRVSCRIPVFHSGFIPWFNEKVMGQLKQIGCVSSNDQSEGISKK